MWTKHLQKHLDAKSVINFLINLLNSRNICVSRIQLKNHSSVSSAKKLIAFKVYSSNTIDRIRAKNRINVSIVAKIFFNCSHTKLMFGKCWLQFITDNVIKTMVFFISSHLITGNILVNVRTNVNIVMRPLSTQRHTIIIRESTPVTIHFSVNIVNGNSITKVHSPHTSGLIWYTWIDYQSKFSNSFSFVFFFVQNSYRRASISMCYLWKIICTNGHTYSAYANSYRWITISMSYLR